MSICRAVTRLALVEAIRGNTSVGANVFDSLIGGLDFDPNGSVSTSEEKPFAAVYSDTAMVETDEFADCGFHANGATMFIIEFGIAAAMFQPASDESGEREIAETGLAATDANLEFSLDLLTRQIMDTIVDPQNAWSAIFLDMLHSVSKLERARIGNDSDGIRLAGQQIRITGALLADPAKGAAIDSESPLAAFFVLAAASGNADLAGKAALLEQAMSSEVADLALMQRMTAMTDPTIAALGLNPLDAQEPDLVLNEAVIGMPQGGEQVVTND